MVGLVDVTFMGILKERDAVMQLKDKHVCVQLCKNILQNKTLGTNTVEVGAYFP